MLRDHPRGYLGDYSVQNEIGGARLSSFREAPPVSAGSFAHYEEPDKLATINSCSGKTAPAAMEVVPPKPRAVAMTGFPARNASSTTSGSLHFRNVSEHENIKYHRKSVLCRAAENFRDNQRRGRTPRSRHLSMTERTTTIGPPTISSIDGFRGAAF